MERYLIRQSISRIQSLLKKEKDKKARQELLKLLASERRQLALLDANGRGALDPGMLTPLSGDSGPESASEVLSRFMDELQSSTKASLLLDPRPGLKIVDSNDDYRRATMMEAARMHGARMFDVFPDNPDEDLADGVANLYTSLQGVARTRMPHAMATQRYDIRDGENRFVERHWQPVNHPVFGHDGRLKYLLHSVEDVTERVLSIKPSAAR